MNVKADGQKLRELRRQKAIERPELARLSGVHWTTIARVELGKTRTMRVSTASKLARALKVSPGEFVGEEVVA